MGKIRLGSDIPGKGKDKSSIKKGEPENYQPTSNLSYPVTQSGIPQQRMLIALPSGITFPVKTSSSTSSCFGPDCPPPGHEQASPPINRAGDLVLPPPCLLLAFPLALLSLTQLISQRRWIDSLQSLWI